MRSTLMLAFLGWAHAYTLARRPPLVTARTRAAVMFDDNSSTWLSRAVASLARAEESEDERLRAMERRLREMLSDGDALLSSSSSSELSSPLTMLLEGTGPAFSWSKMVDRGKLKVDESDDGYSIELLAPGVQAADLDVEASEDGMLRIAGVTHVEEDGATLTSSFSRSVRLPADADWRVMSTDYADDAVHIEIPKKPSRSARAALLGRADSSAEEDVVDEATLNSSPRLRRWLKAHRARDARKADE